MVVLDYIFIGIAGIAFISGLFKGLLKQVLSLVFTVVVLVGTSYLFVYPQQWLSSLIDNETLLSVVSLVATFLVLGLICGGISAILQGVLKSIKILGFVDRLLGAAFGFVIAYAVISVFVMFLTGTSETFLPHLKSLLEGQTSNSWVIANVFQNNFFGDWLLSVIKERLAAAVAL